MRKLLITGLILITSSAIANSETPFPSDWQSWKSVATPLTEIGALPGCDADVSGLPPIYQETVETYCGVRAGGPGAVAVLVKPAVLDNFNARRGGYGDGSNLILHLKDMGVLFVTGHQGGQATYGVFKEDGTDVTDANPEGALGANTCRVCHSGYAAFCAAGQCAAAK
ncbi:MAG: hypothetical protein QNJ91_07360 [Gammaproteobacteria bacterium]|nr:hypothetical protein [Gammaproteobacteria bacterium]